MRLQLLMLALVPASLVAQATPPDPLEALVQDSPFLPAAGAARATATTAGGPLEFHSVVFEHGSFAFSIYDQASRQSKWVKLGPGEGPFLARSFDREHDILTVDYQGRSLALKLQEGHIAGQAPPGAVPAPAALPSAAETARSNPAPNGAAAGPSATGNPQENQRLQNMADEIRRRRQQSPQPPQTSKK